jgi:hypothetical protein
VGKSDGCCEKEKGKKRLDNALLINRKKSGRGEGINLKEEKRKEKGMGDIQ